jgi:8-oxo-dGTP pyrophosphatase MutT (NUDIX family)
MLHQWSHSHETAFNQFMAYKTRVPVCGAIMLNSSMTSCVLVKGYKASSGWGFPKGKINQNEKEVDCAVREVLEETGYNLASEIQEEDYINTIVREQSVTLFIVRGINESYPFKTRTRKEISVSGFPQSHF